METNRTANKVLSVRLKIWAIVLGGMGAALALFGLIVACLPAESSPEADGPGVGGIPKIYDAENVPLAAVFAGWYGHDQVSGECIGGLGSTHWNDGPNTGGVRYTPERGYYCSSDPEIVSWQLDQMEEAGISVLLYSWWGWGDGNLDGVVEGHPDQFINQSLTEMLNQIRDSSRDMKVALIVEPFKMTQGGGSGELSSRESRMVLDYVWEHYYGKYPDHIFQWDGKPLLVPFDPMILKHDKRYTIRKWTGRAFDQSTKKEGWDCSFSPPQAPAGIRRKDG